MVSGIALIRQMLEQLPPSERKIANYILQHPEQVIHMTAKELGEVTDSSSTAVIRLTKSIGVSGWQELKVLLASEHGQKPRAQYREVSAGESVAEIIPRATQNALTILEQTSQILSAEMVAKAIAWMHQAKRIHFFGVSASQLVAQDAMLKWSKVNKATTALTDTHLLAHLLSNSKPEDLLFAISASGETTEVLRLAEMAKEQGVRVIALTKIGKNRLAKMADIALFSAAATEVLYQSAVTSSRIAQLHVIDILFFSYVSTFYEESIQAIDKGRAMIEKYRQVKT